MVGFYLTDEVDVLTVAHDADGAETTTTQAGVRARVAERHRLVLNLAGKEVLGSMQVLLDKAVAVSYDSRIKVKKVAGAAYRLPDKEWEVKSVSTGHGFGVEFTEVWV